MAARKATSPTPDTDAPATKAPAVVADAPAAPEVEVSPFGAAANDYAALALSAAAGLRGAIEGAADLHLAIHGHVPSHPASMLHVRRVKTALDDLLAVAISVESAGALLAGHAAENES